MGKGGQTITEGRGIRLVSIGETCILEFSEPKASNTGTYTVTITSEGGSAHSSVDLFVVEDPDTDFSSICSEGSESFQSPVEDFQSPVEDSDFERVIIDKVKDVAEKQGLEEVTEAEVSKSEKQSRGTSKEPEEYLDALEHLPDSKKVDSTEDKKEVVEKNNKEQTQEVKKEEVALVQDSSVTENKGV